MTPRPLWRVRLREELRRLRRSPQPLLVALVYPLCAWLVLALTFRDSVLHDIPVVVADRDHSSLSRLFTRSVDATQTLRVVEVTSTEEDALTALSSGEATLALIIPKGLEGAIKQGRSGTVVSLSNGANLLWSKIAYRTVMMTGFTLSTGIQIRRLEAKGLPADQALGRALPITTSIGAPGNPWYDYALYLVPGMVFALLQMSACGSTLWIFRRRREDRRGLHIPPPGEKVSSVVAALLPLLAMNLLAILVIFTIIFPLAGLPLYSCGLELFALTLLFTVASMGLGALLSTALPNLVTAAQAALVLNAPAFVFAGYTYPRWAMPEAIQVFANVLPLTHMLDGYFPLFIHDTATSTGLLPLLAFAVVTWGGTFLLVSPLGDRLRLRIRAYRQSRASRSTSAVPTP